jgi:predicted nucleic acid-binding protein
VVTFSLDTSAILRFVDQEAGADRLEEIFDQRDRGIARVIMCAVHWAEVVAYFLRNCDPARAAVAIREVEFLSIEVVPLTMERATQAAHLRTRYKLPFADSFGLELAYNVSGRFLVTADFDVKPAAQDIAIEFLPIKPKA